MTKHQDRAAQTTEMYCLTVWRLDQGHGALRVSSSEASPLGLLTAASSFSMILPVSVCVCVLISPCYQDSSPIALGPTLRTSFNPITSLKTLSPNNLTPEVLGVTT